MGLHIYIYILMNKYIYVLSAPSHFPLMHKSTNSGDITKCKTGDFDMQTDVLSSGPPCVQFAGNGLKQGEEDPRFGAFLAVLSMIVLFAKEGNLSIALLENVFGTLTWLGGVAPIMLRVLVVLREEVTQFYWSLDKLFGHYYRCGASRRRVFLKGIRNNKVSVPMVPPALPALG